MKNHYSVSLVIPSFNGAELLKANIRSVIAAGNAFKGKAEIIVVDDASTDETVKWLKEAFPQIRTVSLKRNVGFALASNVGVRAADAPLVILLNNDVRVEPHFVDPLVDHVTRKGIFATAACMRNPDSPSQVESITRLTWEMGFLHTFWPPPGAVSSFPDGGEIFYACGGAAVYKRSIFLDLGGFETLYHPFYWEDTDICYRAWKRGLASTFCRDAVVWHRPSQTISKVEPQARVRRIWERNKLVFQWRNLSSNRMFQEHLYWLLRHLLWLAWTREMLLLRAWCTAIPKFRAARQRLPQEKKKERLTDEELARRLGGTVTRQGVSRATR